MGKKKKVATGKSIVVAIPVDKTNKQLCLVGGHRKGLLNFPFLHVNNRRATEQTAEEVLRRYFKTTQNLSHITEFAISFTYKVGRSTHKVFVFIVAFERQADLQNGMYVAPSALCQHNTSPLCTQIIKEICKKAA